jgi:ABC-type branched-subunit amino acid transport system ATPase component/ABC-type branched-subunit amino acid transport system permease subunit
VTRTRDALAGAFRDARSAWTFRHSAVVLAVVLAALVPLVAPAWVHVDGLAAGLYLALAATGLWVALGLAGMPSLGQGAFLGIGAFTEALLTAKAGWPVVPATVVGVLAAAAAGALTGIGVVRLRPVFIAVTTWILTWTVFLLLLAFPSVSGGAQGIVVPLTLSPRGHYELALGLLVVAVLGAASLARGPVGIELRATRERPGAAAALGVATARLRLGAFVASAAVGGLAGALSVQLVGVADASDYGPFLSFRLFVSVLIGGAASALGPAAGVAALAAVTGAAGVLGALEGVARERFDPMLASLLLLAVLALGGDGIVPALRRRFLRAGERPERSPGVVAGAVGARATHAREPLLVAENLTKRFGALAAVNGVSLDVRPGEVCALIGPNGSGKTTVLRLLGGTLPVDGGRVLVSGDDVTFAAPREHALRGVVRTLQSTAAFVELTALENVLVGAGLHREHGGALQTVAATPLARGEDAARRVAARSVLDEVGLGWAADVPAGELPGPEQRLLGVAAALATGPRVLLLDEPSAGSSLEDVHRLVSLLERLRDRGVAVLLVEHNLRLVRSVADRVVVMAAGAVIASGSPAEVAADTEVRTAFLGRQAL